MKTQSTSHQKTELQRINSENIHYIVDEKNENFGYLGCGSFGVVIAAFYDGKTVAAKCSLFGGGDRDRENLEKEVKHELGLVYRAHHANVVRVFGWTLWKHSVAIVMEYMPGGDLWALLRNKSATVSVRLAFQMCYDIACGLSYIHRQKLVHSDIKTENILLDENLRCKIADFGCARLSALYTGYSMRSLQQEENHFTDLYAAPELLENQCISRHSSQDTYSFAIMIYVILQRDRPVTMPHLRDLFIFQTKAGVRPQFSDKAKETFKNSKEAELLVKTMRRCWSHDRPSMTEEKENLREHYEILDQSVIAEDVKKCKEGHKIVYFVKENYKLSSLQNYEIPKDLQSSQSVIQPAASDMTGEPSHLTGVQNDGVVGGAASHHFRPPPFLAGGIHQQNHATRHVLPAHLQPSQPNLQTPFYYPHPLSYQGFLPSAHQFGNLHHPAQTAAPAVPPTYIGRPSPSKVLQPNVSASNDSFSSPDTMTPGTNSSALASKRASNDPYYNPPSVPSHQASSLQYQQPPTPLGPFPVQNLVITLQLVPSPYLMVPNPDYYYQASGFGPQTYAAASSFSNINAFPSPSQSNTAARNYVTTDNISVHTNASLFSTIPSSVGKPAVTGPSTSTSGRIESDALDAQQDPDRTADSGAPSTEESNGSTSSSSTPTAD